MDIILHGALNLPWWGYILVTLALTHITISSVTIYLHRTMAHRAVDLHPIASHFFRLWLWLTTGMVTKEWTAVHRKHHARVETEEDPHSPQILGINNVLFKGAELYRRGTSDKETLERYGQGTPEDWMERNVYSHSTYGILTMLAIDWLLFGPIGLSMWAVQMAWIPFFAAGVINGLAHFWGYRNFECQDASRNISPLGFLIGGEELHNNHHTYATSAKFSVKWWEIDIGWYYICLMRAVGLAKPKRVPPKPALVPGKAAIDAETLAAVLTNRFQLLATYSENVMLPVLREERARADERGRAVFRKIQTFLIRDASLVDARSQEHLNAVLKQHQPLGVVYQFRLKLQNIWARSTASQKELIEALQEWCRQAEETGITVLRQFVAQLKAYVPQRRAS